MWLHSEIVLGILDVFLSVSFFSQTRSLAVSADPVLGDSLSKSNQWCTERGLSLGQTALLPNMKSQLHDAGALLGLLLPSLNVHF